MTKKKIGIATILGIIISISVVVTTLFKFDARYEKSADAKESKSQMNERIDYVYQVSMKNDQEIIKDLKLERLRRRANALEERMWKLEKEYGKSESMPEVIRDEYRRLKKEREEILKEIDRMYEEDKKERDE